MKLKKVVIRISKNLVWFLSIFLIACSSLVSTPDQVAPEARISLLKGGPHDGSWQSFDIVLEYQYHKMPGENNLSVQGKAKRKYDELRVWVLFTDAQGTILERKSIYASGYRSSPTLSGIRKRSFENTFTIPLEVTYLSFGSYLQPYVGRNQ